MGSHSQRRRSAGSSGPIGGLLAMQRAVLFGTHEIDVCYNDNVDLNSLAPEDFRTGPAEFFGSTFEYLSASCIRIDFGDDIDAEISISYLGQAIGFLVPDTVAIA